MARHWENLVLRVGWEFARPDAKRSLAFVYAATIGLHVETASFGVNPDLADNELIDILTREPDCLRPAWLRDGWPNLMVRSDADLIFYGLLHLKARLAAGALIPDGSAQEMEDACKDLFPRAYALSTSASIQYQACHAVAYVEIDHRASWGYGGPMPRDGLAVPLDGDSGNRSAFEVFLQNQMRIDIQRRIETKSFQVE
jgi:hypothetical protein